MEIEVDMPPAIGGGSFVMRELTTGEYEDAPKRATRGTKAGQSSDALVDLQADQIVASLTLWKGKLVPHAGSEKEAFWRELTTRQRHFVVGIFDKLHSVPEQEIGDFFEAAVAARSKAAEPKNR